MIGILIGYVALTVLIANDVLRNPGLQVAWTALLISLVTFTELTDVILERIEHYRRTDFYNALLVSGMREARIVNVEILWTNSLAHILHKLIQTFGMAIFLQASIDFIVSVGLSTDVSLSNFPATLGNLLATIDSKQDILAISVLFDDPSYLAVLPLRHAQGLSVAFLIVFTLYCVYRLGNALVRRYHL
jgi:ABC-type dipeptide/oligopeptide/nickel transport system permease subunit